MFNDMRVAVGLQRAKTLSAIAYPTIGDILRLATIGGAVALDMADQIGSLTPGKKADLIILNRSVGVNTEKIVERAETVTERIRAGLLN